MSEWGVFLVISALIGFAITIMTPIIKLTASITKLTASTEYLKEVMDRLSKDSALSNDKIWKHEEVQDAKIENHENRIIRIESKGIKD